MRRHTHLRAVRANSCSLRLLLGGAAEAQRGHPGGTRYKEGPRLRKDPGKDVLRAECQGIYCFFKIVKFVQGEYQVILKVGQVNAAHL